MILSNSQQKRFIYFLTLGLLILIGIPLIILLSKRLDLSNPQNFIGAILTLGVCFLIVHQLLIKIILMISIKNQVQQEDLKFASLLIYTKINEIKFILSKKINPQNDEYHLNYKTEKIIYPHIRKRAIFTILAIEKTPNVVLTAELRKKLQDEWTAHLELELSFEEAFHLWRKEVNEVSPLVLKHLINIKSLSTLLSKNPDLKSIDKLLDSITTNMS